MVIPVTTTTAKGYQMSIYYVVPCGAEKATTAAPARDLYVSPTFRFILRAAIAEAEATTRDLGVEARVLILSAKHGLVDLDDVLAPYDLRITDNFAVTADEVAEQITARGIGWGDEVYALLPDNYRRLLTEAAALADDIAVQDVYEAAPGIGYQRGVAASLIRHAA